METTRSEQIAADPEEVQKLLDINKSLSVALLSRKVQDLDKKVASLAKRQTAMEASQQKARVAFGKLRDELQKPKEPVPDDIPDFP